MLTVTPSPSDTNHSLRMIVGNGLRPDVWKVFVERFKIPLVLELYGSTEGNANIGTTHFRLDIDYYKNHLTEEADIRELRTYLILILSCTPFQ